METPPLQKSLHITVFVPVRLVVLLVAHLLQIHVRGGLAAEHLVRLCAAAVRRNPHGSSLLRLACASAPTGNAAPPSDDADNDQYEAEAAHEDLWPSGEYLLLVPRVLRRVNTSSVALPSAVAETSAVAAGDRGACTYILCFSASEIGECCI